MANGMHSSRRISSTLVHGAGFSKGCDELALKNPPPFVPSSLIASCEATGPPGSTWVPPVIVPTSVKPLKFCATPATISAMAATIDSGSSSLAMPRVRSTQKLPIVDEPRRAKPRTSAIATAMPTEADTKFCTASPASCTV